MNFFNTLEPAAEDPTFGLHRAFHQDPREHKVNLGVGAYKTEDLKPLVLPSVKKAERWLLDHEPNKEYLSIEGDSDFLRGVEKLVLGQDSPALVRVASAQCIGGTGALRVGAQFLITQGFQEAFVSDPTWENHHRVFQHAGFLVGTYPYYSRKKGLDFDGMRSALEGMPKKSVFVVQPSCHNPTGLDLSREQWKELLRIMEQKKVLPFFDFAYQGFGEGLMEDAMAIRLCVESGLSFLAATSCSKNFGLYGERVGALLAVAPSREAAAAVKSHIKVAIRGNYSNPPCHGARIVGRILSNQALGDLWEEDLAMMRTRIQTMRADFARALKSDEIASQKGMFSFTGLSEKQVEQLLGEYAIYLPKDGRVNVAGLTPSNMDYVTQAINAVRSTTPP